MVVQEVLMGQSAPLAPPRPTPRPSSRETFVVSTGADVVPPLPSDAATAADLSGSEGARSALQAERTAFGGGGIVTPTAVLGRDIDEEQDKGSEAGSADDKDFCEK